MCRPILPGIHFPIPHFLLHNLVPKQRQNNHFLLSTGSDIIKTMHSRHREKNAKQPEAIKLTGSQNAVEQASERGASTWLTAIPMTKYGFGLHKQVFGCSLLEIWVDTREAVLTLPVWAGVHSGTCICVLLPERSFAFNQTQSGPGHHSTAAHGGLPQCRRIEPTLQPLTGESFPLRSTNVEEGTRLDIRVQNVCMEQE